MNYAVYWVPDSEQDLASGWLKSSDRNAVTRAAHVLEEGLKKDPLHLGESRLSSVQRVAFEPPLGIEYEVIEDDKKVRVLGVWLTETQGKGE